MPQHNLNPRYQALKLLQQVLQGQSLANLFEQNEVDSLTKQLAFGVCRYYFQLEYLINRCLKKPLPAKQQPLLLLMMLGVYQLLYLRIPDHAAISETVSLTKTIKMTWAKQLVNAVLRRLQREREDIQAMLQQNPLANSGHPPWLFEKIQQAWPEHADAIFQANNQQAPMSLRVNLSKISREDYCQLLSEKNSPAKLSTMVESGVVLQQAVAVQELPGFEQGWVSVQDQAAQLAAYFLPIKSGDNVLDACAAPGGKTCHCLELHSDVSLLAIDNQATRMQRLQENCQRLQLNAKTIVADAIELKHWWDGQYFDAILLDAPCSATGVIRRHPDIKLLRRETDIAALQQTQLALLNTLWQTVKMGGYCLYVTCSILPEENEHVIADFLQQQSDAKVVSLKHPAGITLKHGWQCLPGDGDGFYYCLLMRNEE